MKMLKSRGPNAEICGTLHLTPNQLLYVEFILTRCFLDDSKLSFSTHIKSAISKTRKGISLLKYLSKYLPRDTLNEVYKLYVRPHLDYGDVIYHAPAKICDFTQNAILPNLMEKIESVQYSAALAVT